MKEIDNHGSEIFPSRESVKGKRVFGSKNKTGVAGVAPSMAAPLLSIGAAGLITLAAVTGNLEASDPVMPGGYDVGDPPAIVEVQKPVEKPTVTAPPVKKPPATTPPTTPPPVTKPPTTSPPTTPPGVPIEGPSTDTPTEPPKDSPTDAPTEPPTEPPEPEPPEPEPPEPEPFTEPTVGLTMAQGSWDVVDDQYVLYLQYGYTVELGSASSCIVDPIFTCEFYPSWSASGGTEAFTPPGTSFSRPEILVTAAAPTYPPDMGNVTLTVNSTYAGDQSGTLTTSQSFAIPPE